MKKQQTYYALVRSSIKVYLILVMLTFIIASAAINEYHLFCESGIEYGFGEKDEGKIELYNQGLDGSSVIISGKLSYKLHLQNKCMTQFYGDIIIPPPKTQNQSLMNV